LPFVQAKINLSFGDHPIKSILFYKKFQKNPYICERNSFFHPNFIFMSQNLAISNLKLRLINVITLSEDVELLQYLEQLCLQTTQLRQSPLLPQKSALQKLTKPRPKKLDIEQLKKEQGFVQFNRIEFDKLVRSLNIQEPIENLIKMI
jgi:hypothetical protein